MSNDLKDKVAVIAGSGHDLGRAIALLLAGEGAAVVISTLGKNSDHSGQPLPPAQEVVRHITANGGRALARCDDVTSFSAAEHLISNTIKEFGRLDILINTVGHEDDRPLLDLREEDLDRVVATNLKAAFNCTRHASVHMRQQKSGRIINLSSTIGLYGHAGQASYGAATDGIAGLTRVVARDLGKYGITVNAIAASVQRAGDLRTPPASYPTPAAQLQPALEVCEADEVAPFAVYLSTDEAANINGQTFRIARGSISLLNYPAPARTITKLSRWTPEEIATLFPSTFGIDLLNPAPHNI